MESMNETAAATNAGRQRNSRACENCRSSKSRCVYKSQISICHRCEQNGFQCVVRAKARPMRTKAAQPSSSTLENKSTTTSLKAEEYVMNLPAMASPNTGKDILELHERHNGLFEDGENSPPTTNSNNLNPTLRPSTIQQRSLTFTQASILLASYREKAGYFPFVHISPEATVSSLSRESPFLLLAILTSASARDPELYHQLSYQFKRALSTKVIMEGCKSLEYLQGLLIYIAWYPIHINPKNPQAFMYMNLAISMIIDLELNREIPNPATFKSFNTSGLFSKGLFTQAARDAFLGCWYLSSSTHLIFPSLTFESQRPNPIPYIGSTDDLGEPLISGESFSETNAHFRLQRLAERIVMADAKTQMKYSAGPMGEVMVQTFLNELGEWHELTSNKIKTLPSLGILERYIRVSIYSRELGFFIRPYRDHLRTLITKPPNPTNTPYLLSCLDACKKFLDYLVYLDQSAFLHFTSVQWGSIVGGVLVMSRLTFIMAATLGWNSETTRLNVPLVMYLDCLCYRFESLSSTSRVGGHEIGQTTTTTTTTTAMNPDFFHIFNKILSSVKKSYERRVGNLQAPVSSSSPFQFLSASSNSDRDSGMGIGGGIGISQIKGHCPMLDPSLSGYFEATESNFESAFDAINSTASTELSPRMGMGMADVGNAPFQPFYHDLWATMTGNWADGL